GSDNSDGSQLADVVPVRRYGSRENIGSELEFERQRQIPRQCEPDTVVVLYFPSQTGPYELEDGQYDPDCNNCCSEHFHDKPQPPYACINQRFRLFPPSCPAIVGKTSVSNAAGRPDVPLPGRRRAVERPVTGAATGDSGRAVRRRRPCHRVVGTTG